MATSDDGRSDADGEHSKRIDVPRSNREKKRQALEDGIKDLSGVRGARVDCDDSGVRGVRVLVVPERRTDQTIRDVQTLAAQLTLGPVEPAQIQVLRTSEAGMAPQRRKLSSLLTERSDGRFKAKVTLELGGDVLVGESDSPSAREFEYRSLAQAIIDGMQELLDFPVQVDGVRMLEAGADELAVVVLHRGDERLVGSAVVRLDEYDGIARATLDALNRFVGRTAPAEQAAGR